MQQAVEGVQKFKKTIDTDREVSRIESGWYKEHIWLFDEYPYLSVRKAILRYLLDHSVTVPNSQADWIEKRIGDLKEEEVQTHSGFWKDLLDWYIFCSEGETANRAIDFAIGITKMPFFSGREGFLYRSDILKFVAAKLERSPQIYWETKTSTLRLFLGSFLVEAYRNKWSVGNRLMVDIRRVIRCAVGLEERRFLPFIEKVLYKMSIQPQSKKYDFKEEAETKENLAFLREAVRFFREKTQTTQDVQ